MIHQIFHKLISNKLKHKQKSHNRKSTIKPKTNGKIFNLGCRTSIPSTQSSQIHKQQLINLNATILFDQYQSRLKLMKAKKISKIAQKHWLQVRTTTNQSSSDDRYHQDIIHRKEIYVRVQEMHPDVYSTEVPWTAHCPVAPRRPPALFVSCRILQARGPPSWPANATSSQQHLFAASTAVQKDLQNHRRESFGTTRTRRRCSRAVDEKGSWPPVPVLGGEVPSFPIRLSYSWS